MKTVGTDQLLAMKFKRLPLSDEWSGVMGNLPEVFMFIVYGESGEGKTEFCMQFAKELAKFGHVKWMGYETGHGPDLQQAIQRNNLAGLPISWIDPWEETGRKKKKDNYVIPPTMPLSKNEMSNQLFIDLIRDMSKPHSAKYWIIDSLDMTKFTEDQVTYLRSLFIKKKGIIWIGHAKGTVIERSSCRKAEFYSQAGFLCRKYICAAQKNRFGGFDNRYVWLEKAKELNPLFFEKMEEEKKNKPKPKRVRKPKKVPAPEVIANLN